MFKASVLAALTIGASADLATSSPEQVKEMWETFKQTHSKSYSTMSEEQSRFQKFVENLSLIDRRNAEERTAGGSAVHGITQFSDLSQSEFADIFLTLDVSKMPEVSNATLVTDVKPYTGPAGLVDWTSKYVTAVKNQGYCGSCWAFSASEQIESDAIRQVGWSKTWLSPEQLVDCDSRSSGCNGGWPEWAYDYVRKAGGIELESDYPYSAYYGNSGSCKASSSKFKIGVNGYSTLAQSESKIASYVQGTGPVSICIDASNWNSYTGGILASCGQNVNHAVQAVGVDTSSYWKVRNSWGASWGESGFIRLKYGSNTCNVQYRASYTSVFKK